MSTDSQDLPYCDFSKLTRADPAHLNIAATFRVTNDLSNQPHSSRTQAAPLSPTVHHDGTLEKHHRDNAVLEPKSSAQKTLE